MRYINNNTYDDTIGYPSRLYKFSRTQKTSKALVSKRSFLFRITSPGGPVAALLIPGSVCAPQFTLVQVWVSINRTSNNQILKDVNPNLDTTEEVPVTSLGSGVIDSKSESKIVSSPKNIDLPMMLNPARTMTDLTLIDYLKRPVILSSGSLAATDVATTFTSILYPSVPLSDALRANKVLGLMFIRATSVFTLQVNANKFQAGRYILAVTPLGGQNSNVSSATESYLMHRFTLTQTTQLLHVEIDLNCETEVTLRVPYQSVEYSFSIQTEGQANKASNLGRVFITPYVPLVTTAGSSTVPYTLYHHFEDIELSGNTMPQSGDWNPFPLSKSLDSIDTVPQAGSVEFAKKKSPTDVEAT